MLKKKKKKKRLELPEVYSFIYCIHILYEPAMGMQEMLQKQRAKQCPQGAHRLAAGDTAGPGTELGAVCSQGQRERERKSLSERQVLTVESRNAKPRQKAAYTMVEQTGNSCMYFGFALLMDVQS